MHLQIICKLFQGEVALMCLVFEALTWLTGGPYLVLDKYRANWYPRIEEESTVI